MQKTILAADKRKESEAIEGLAHRLRDVRDPLADEAADCIERLYSQLEIAEQTIARLHDFDDKSLGSFASELMDKAKEFPGLSQESDYFRRAADEIRRLLVANKERTKTWNEACEAVTKYANEINDLRVASGVLEDEVKELNAELAKANERAAESDYHEMNSIENEEVCGDALAENAKLKEEVADLKRRCNLPALVDEARAVTGKRLIFASWGSVAGAGLFDVTGRDFAEAAKDSVSVPLDDWNNGQPLIDYIEANRKPPLPEQLKDGALVRVACGDECRIKDNTVCHKDPSVQQKYRWRSMGMTWDHEGKVSSPDPDGCWDIVEVISSATEEKQS